MLYNIEFLNANEQRSYPLFESATRTDATGSFVLPNDFLLELCIPVHAGLDVEPENFFLAGITSFATGYSVAIGYDDGSAAPPVVATATIARAAHVEYNSYALTGSGDFDDVVGRVTVGVLDSIDAQPAGAYTFAPAAGRLDPDCVRPMIRGVSSLTVVNGTERSPRMYGDFELVGGDNMQISVTSIGAVNQIRFDAIDGAGLTENCSCDDGIGPPIRTINLIAPTADGNFTLRGNSCLQVVGEANGIQLNDTCSQPCCGCAELTQLTQELDQFGDEATTLRNFMNQLQGQVNAMETSLLASRLNSSGCSTC